MTYMGQAAFTVTLSCDGIAGPAIASIDVTINPPVEILSFTTNPDLIDFGGLAILSWDTLNADECTLQTNTEDPIVVEGADTLTVMPTVTTTYTLSCSGVNGPAIQGVQVTVNPPVEILTFTGPAGEVPYATDVQLQWSTQNADSCQIEDVASGTIYDDVGPMGTIAAFVGGEPGGPQQWTITCEGSGGPVTQNLNAIVANEICSASIFLATQYNDLTEVPCSSGTCEITECNTITGQIQVQGNGDSISANSGLSLVNLPKLASVGNGGYWIADSVPTEVNLPNLISVAGVFRVKELIGGANWHTVNIPRLRTVGDGSTGVEIGNVNTAVGGLYAGSLETVSGYFIYGAGMPSACSFVDLTSLKTVTGDMEVLSNATPLPEQLPLLETVGGNLSTSLATHKYAAGDVSDFLARVSVAGTTSFAASPTGQVCP